MNQLLALDSLRYAGDMSVTSAQYEAALAQADAAHQQYAEHADGLAAVRQGRIQALLALNAAVSADLTPAQNHKIVNDIVFRLLLNDSISAGDAADLEAIAGQCPLEGGDAVYEARAVVAARTGAHYEDEDLCATAAPRARRQTQDALANVAASIALYPNPTTGWVFWTSPVSEPLRLRVFNAVGQQVAEIVSAKGSADLSHLPAGLYYVHLLRTDDTVLGVHKIYRFDR
ncbi:MAG: T9SS type A sorting domain-containing protein [Saprospiraceae bacterium]|nr:T9SS type A sorting domain-containing protein [Saprospiraceae bacterium]MDW8483049.1 T9SS type A sorting domain-containing protein [Saprospiraceae bacterium]